ncbi:MAG: X2-like carbohydrate binding domain-containing protein [Clostridia bacterium]
MTKKRVLIPLVCFIILAIVGASCALAFTLGNKNYTFTANTSNGENNGYVNNGANNGDDVIITNPDTEYYYNNTLNASQDITLKGCDANYSFLVKVVGKTAYVGDEISVRDAFGEKVVLSFADKGDGKYLVSSVAPYQKGSAYTVVITSKLVFVGTYAKVNSYNFLIAKEETEVATLNKSVIVLASAPVVDVANSTLTVAENVKVGDILTYENSAYRVSSINADGSVVYSTPDLSEVFAEFDFYKATKGDDVVVNAKEIATQMQNSSLALGLAKELNTAKPDVKVNFNKIAEGADAGKYNVTVILTFTLDNGLQVTIDLKNIIGFNTMVSLNKDFSNFQLGAKIVNNSTTAVRLNYNKSGVKQDSIQSIIAKLNAYNDKEKGKDEVVASAFTWVQPLGAFGNISYNLDLVFRFNFAGAIGIEVPFLTTYDMGIYMVDGKMSNYSNLTCDVQPIHASMYGELKLKAGVINTLNLSILNIANLGLEFEVGAYSDIYGLLDATFDIKNKTAYADGAFYLEGGVYYDLNFLYGIGIPAIKLDKSGKTDIINGQVKLFDIGNKEFDYRYSADNAKNITINSKETTIPTVNVDVCDITKVGSGLNYASSLTKTPIAFENLAFTIKNGNANFSIINNKIVLNNANSAFEDVITVKYGNFSYDIKVVKIANVPMIEKDSYSFNKNAPKDVIIPITLNGSTFTGIDANEIIAKDYSYADGNITINALYFVRQNQGDNAIVIKTNNGNITLNVNVFGNVKLDSYGEGTQSSPYKIYSKDQIIELFANENATYENVYFMFQNNINMFGSTLNSLNNFKGNFIGNGFELSNFTVNNNANGKAGLFLVNNGLVNNVKFVNVTLNNVITNDAYVSYAGIIAGVNNGTIKNCSTENVTVTSTYTSYKLAWNDIKIYAGVLVGSNSGILENNTTNGIVNTNIKFDLLNVYCYIGGVAGLSSVDTIDCTSTAVLNLNVELESIKNVRNNAKIAVVANK